MKALGFCNYCVAPVALGARSSHVVHLLKMCSSLQSTSYLANDVFAYLRAQSNAKCTNSIHLKVAL
ncbi:hypothetical protein COEREDRAFT_80694 [Coemansia reversa NRRL 1564]|uniref:Uncharacterized protein n=1 Tax=Coemansia reversa (strain ATCC 12441 / NRRL 1564) TaxID=763665 RepID=A0A2G5BF82_COERN|nr:hypothetical protein COEREDRAFT_80694 [Coemansia reversa NRRL 1564]|eukprot:PIA17377.1 hypothetical protein COEREDRAFT_80694 [Coemansia reversa NRRL 1564]